MSDKQHILNVVFKGGANYFDGQNDKRQSEVERCTKQVKLVQRVIKGIQHNVKKMDPEADTTQSRFERGDCYYSDGHHLQDAQLNKAAVTRKPLNVAELMAEDHGARIFGGFEVKLRTDIGSSDENFGSEQTVMIKTASIHPSLPKP